MPTCRFFVGDGVGGTETQIATTDNREQCAALVYNHYPTANGATYSNNNDTKCYAEFEATGNNGNILWQTCLFRSKFF